MVFAPYFLERGLIVTLRHQSTNFVEPMIATNRMGKGEENWFNEEKSYQAAATASSCRWISA